MIELLFSFDAWVAFLTLTALELVLGIDNIIFISILVENLPESQREKARKLGLFMAMFMRIALLFLLSWLIGLTAPLFEVFGYDFSGRDLILMGGGLFLIWKSTGEIHGLIEGEEEHVHKAARAGFWGVIFQIMMLDLIFSLDSIITAVGMVNQIPIMVAAVIVAVALMIVFAKAIGDFISTRPTIKMLALSFLVVVGVALLADGFGHHVPRGYIYFAMAYSTCVELLNMRIRSHRTIRADEAKSVPANSVANGDSDTRSS